MKQETEDPQTGTRGGRSDELAGNRDPTTFRTRAIATNTRRFEIWGSQNAVTRPASGSSLGI
jgi:hypothetical protein